MKKIKASEITEALQKAFNLGENYCYQGESEFYSQNKKAATTLAQFIELKNQFAKAEPPKVCRWKRFGSITKDNLAQCECIDNAVIKFYRTWTFCPYCSGSIEIEGE